MSPESERERINRNVNELLQELRVAQAGVQILFGFLLAVAFTDAYARASGFQRGVHLVTMLFATASVALFTTPVAWHRMLFRRGQRPGIVEVANTMALAGLICLALAMVGTVLLVTDVVLGGWPAAVITVLVAAGFGLLWFVLPLRVRRRNDG
ncbi:MAG: DUF6328 family protein [Labedaea sp.]